MEQGGGDDYGHHDDAGDDDDDDDDDDGACGDVARDIRANYEAVAAPAAAAVLILSGRWWRGGD